MGKFEPDGAYKLIRPVGPLQSAQRAEVLAYIASMWPWIEDDPDAGRWAGEFLEARTGAAAGIY